jgi:hypothetical protein
MGDYERAQAVEFVRALCHQLREMTSQLERIERQGVTGTNGRACAMRLEAAALRKDIREAQRLIDRLRRRYYLEGAPSAHSPTSRAAISARSSSN